MAITQSTRLTVSIVLSSIIAMLCQACNSNSKELGEVTSPLSASAASAPRVTSAIITQQVTLEAKTKDVRATTKAVRGFAVENLRGKFSEFSLPAGSFPQLTALSREGAIFFAQGIGNKIGRIAIPTAADTGKISVDEYPVPTPNSFPIGIAVAPDGNVWFTEKSGHKIGKLDVRTNSITEYDTPTKNSGPVGIAIGPDNTIWFTEADANKLGKLDPNNPRNIQEFSLPTPDSSPIYITLGPDRALWFVEVKGHKIGRIDPSNNSIQEYATSTPNSGPACIITGPDNALWVSELNADKIARFDVNTKTFTDEIPIDSRKNGPRAGPGILVIGTDRTIWFTEMYANQIGRVNVQTKQIHEFTAPTTVNQGQPGPPPIASAGGAGRGQPAWRDENKGAGAMRPSSGPGSIVVSPNGDIWYTAMFAHKIARLRVNRG